MPAASDATSETAGAAALPWRSRPEFWVFLGAFFYAALHLVWYWGTPLGQVPVLDERENIELAVAIGNGSLPPGPFYRAMGYPLLLAAIHAFGVPASLLHPVALLLGVFWHAASAALVAIWARRLTGNRTTAPWLAGLLFALNPVLVHFATQTTDGALATWLFLIGAVAFTPASLRNVTSSTALIVAIVAWSLAAWVRPQFLLLVIALPVIFLWSRPREIWRHELKPLLIGAALGALPWFALGAVQWQHSGAFRILPTQGAYNLWAANRPGAHGRYFAQSIPLPASEIHRNPTAVETELLYTRETGRPADDIDVVNAHWRQRLRDALRQDPLGFAGRLLRKTYFLLHPVESYNNKTYAFHQARSPWLRYNPLGWAVLLPLAILGAASLRLENRPGFRVLMGTAAAIAAGVVLTFVSARFRVPLVACLCAASGGLVLLKRFTVAQPKPAMIAVVIALIGVGLGFTAFGGIDRRDTELQDHLLIAGAANELGDDALVWQSAEAALTFAPEHIPALRWRILAGFNLLLRTGALPDENTWATACRDWLQLAPPATDNSLRVIASFGLWRAGDSEAAIALWQQVGATASEVGARYEAQAALTLIGSDKENTNLPPRDTATSPVSPLERMVWARVHPERLPPEDVVAWRTAAARLLQRPSHD